MLKTAPQRKTLLLICSAVLFPAVILVLGSLVWLNGGWCVTSVAEVELLRLFNERFLKDEPFARVDSKAGNKTLCVLDRQARVELGYRVRALCQVWTNVNRTAFTGTAYLATRCGDVFFEYGFHE